MFSVGASTTSRRNMAAKIYMKVSSKAHFKSFLLAGGCPTEMPADGTTKCSLPPGTSDVQ